MFRHILAPIDDSECSKAAFDQALSLASDLHAQLTICYVSDDPRIESKMVLVQGDIVAQWRDMLRAEGRAILREALAQAKERGISPDAWLLHGEPVEAIAEFAGECSADLIMLGSHGRTGVRRLFIGSVAEGLMRIAPVPVLVVREKPLEPLADSRGGPTEQVQAEPKEISSWT